MDYKRLFLILSIAIALILFFSLMYFTHNSVYEAGYLQGSIDAEVKIATYQTSNLKFLVANSSNIFELRLEQLCEVGKR